jgi:hypothetical protein
MNTRREIIGLTEGEKMVHLHFDETTTKTSKIKQALTPYNN